MVQNDSANYWNEKFSATSWWTDSRVSKRRGSSSVSRKIYYSVSTSHELFEIELNHIVARDNASCRSQKRKSSPLRLKSVTTATIHSLRSDREDLHAITILIRFFLKTISFETQEIDTNLYVRLFPITDSISSRDAKNPATNVDLWRSMVTKKNVDWRPIFGSMFWTYGIPLIKKQFVWLS
jgi:hypothetical protein